MQLRTMTPVTRPHPTLTGTADDSASTGTKRKRKNKPQQSGPTMPRKGKRRWVKIKPADIRPGDQLALFHGYAFDMNVRTVTVSPDASAPIDPEKVPLVHDGATVNVRYCTTIFRWDRRVKMVKKPVKRALLDLAPGHTAQMRVEQLAQAADLLSVSVFPVHSQEDSVRLQVTLTKEQAAAMQVTELMWMAPVKKLPDNPAKRSRKIAVQQL